MQSDRKSHQLQPVQQSDISHVNLPPSIPVSMDGEEGAYAYNQRLQLSNAEAKPECYQPPPNRTIYQDDSLTMYSRSTSTLKELSSSATSGGDATTDSKRNAPPPSGGGHGSTKGLPHRFGSKKSSSASSTGGDYVYSSVLSDWRNLSPDRSESKPNAMPPNQATAEVGASGGGVPDETGRKQRSSSADSVKRLMAKLQDRFTRKAPKPKSSQPSPTVHHPQKAFDKVVHGNMDAAFDDTAKDGSAPWELPPNYVDMIFTRDPITNENQSDLVEKDKPHGANHQV